MPNGVNFRIINDENLEKVVHHNRLSAVVEDEQSDQETEHQHVKQPVLVPRHQSPTETEQTICSSSAVSSDSSSDSDSSVDADDELVRDVPRVYPRRSRIPRRVEGAVPWSAVKI